MTKADLRQIFDKTRGHCHFCGDRISFSRRGKGQLRRKGSGWRTGSWEVDHVTQRHKGGRDGPDNYLPACTGCNRLRWHRKGKYSRESILLGLIARGEIKRQTKVGLRLQALLLQRIRSNRQRRDRRRRG